MIIQIKSGENVCNCYVVEEDGFAVIIDPGCSETVLKEFDHRGWKAEYILLTHEHFDHIGGLEEVRKTLDTPLVACRLCSERIQSVRSNLSNIADILEYFRTGTIAEKQNDPFICQAAEIIYDDRYEMAWRGHRFSFRRLPGHSPASTLITMDNNTVFTGDYLIYGEEETLRLKDGSPEGFEKITRPILEKIPTGTRICPGHGECYDYGQE